MGGGGRVDVEMVADILESPSGAIQFRLLMASCDGN